MPAVPVWLLAALWAQSHCKQSKEDGQRLDANTAGWLVASCLCSLLYATEGLALENLCIASSSGAEGGGVRVGRVNKHLSILVPCTIGTIYHVVIGSRSCRYPVPCHCYDMFQNQLVLGFVQKLKRMPASIILTGKKQMMKAAL